MLAANTPGGVNMRAKRLHETPKPSENRYINLIQEPSERNESGPLQVMKGSHKGNVEP